MPRGPNHNWRALGRKYSAEHSAWLTRAVGSGFGAFLREKQAKGEGPESGRPDAAGFRGAGRRDLAPGCPRIPTREVDESVPGGRGGFDGLRSRATGRRHAASWWRIALSRLRLR